MTGPIDPYDAPAMTLRFMKAFYQGDVEWLAGALADDFVGIGAQSDQFALTKRDVLVNCTHMPRIIMSDCDFRQVTKTGPMRIVDGRYNAYVDPSERMAFASEQRVSSMWREESDGLRMVHAHLSNPMGQTVAGECFPSTYAKKTMRYFELVGRQEHYRNQIDLMDVDGTRHMPRMFDIVFIEAKKQDCLIHLTDRTIRVHEGFARLAVRAGLGVASGFVQVHRSFWVNVLYVRSVGSEDVSLTTGDCVPIARRRRREILDAIHAARTEATVSSDSPAYE